MAAPERRRLILFLGVCAALAGSALAFALGGNELGAPRAVPTGVGGDGGASGRVAIAAARSEQRLEREVTVAARRFLAAFLPYEVGELTPSTTRALRRSATSSFAEEMLARPPTPAPPGMAAAAELGPIAVAFVSALPPRAVVSGSVDRGGFTERLSFVFERRGSAWLVSGAGE
jgi:hypothetical protein